MEKEFKKIRKVRSKFDDEIMARDGVNAVGMGYKSSNGKKTKKLSVIIFVRRKMSEVELTPQNLIPKVLVADTGEEVVTDVVESGDFYAQAFTGRFKTWVPNGASIGHPSVTAGTLGTVATENLTGDKVILSNNHVLANLNNASIGDLILQPGPMDGGIMPDDAIATLFRKVDLKFNGENNLVDAAIALDTRGMLTNTFPCNEIGDNDKVVGLLYGGTPTHTCINPITDVVELLNITFAPREIVEPSVGMNVHKCGRTTEYSAGTIASIDTSCNVNYGRDIFGNQLIGTFAKQIITGPMSEGGDSGSLILEGGPGGIIPVGFDLPGQKSWACSVESFGASVDEDLSTQIDTSKNFRDKRLGKSQAGKDMIDQFYANKSNINSIVNSDDPDVKKALKEKGPKVLNWIIDAVDADAKGVSKKLDDKEMLQYGQDILDTFSAKADKKLLKEIKKFEALSNKFKGKTISEILDDLDKEHKPKKEK